MAWITAFNRISSPPADSNFSFQPLILLTIRSIRKLKQSVLSTPTFAGKPKYLSVRASVIIFSIVHNCSLISTFVLGLKKILDFSTLTSCPDAAQYKSSADFSVSALCWLAFIKINESSVKRRFVTGGASLQTLTPDMFPFSSACESKAFNPSVHNKKRYGDSGSPYLNPLVGLNLSPSSSLILTLYSTIETHCIIKLIHSRRKPNFNIISFKKSPLNSIIGFVHIKFYSTQALSTLSFILDCVKTFVGH